MIAKISTSATTDYKSNTGIVDNAGTVGNDALSPSEINSINAMVAALEGIRNELYTLIEKVDPSQRGELRSQLSTLNGNISTLIAAKSGSRSGISGAIASAGGVVNGCIEKISEEKIEAWDNSTASLASNYNKEEFAGFSRANRSFVATSFASDLGWYSGLNTESKAWFMNDVASQIARDPELKSAITAARSVSEDPALKQIQDEKIIRNKNALEEAKAYAKSTGDEDIAKVVAEEEKLTASRQKANVYSFEEKWLKFKESQAQLKAGTITAEDFAASKQEFVSGIENKTAERKTDFKEINDKVFAMNSKEEMAAIEAEYRKANPNSEKATNEQLQQFLKTKTLDPKEVNHALYDEKTIGFANMTPERQAVLTMAKSQSRMQLAEIAYDITSFRDNLTEKEKEQIKELLKDGKKEDLIKFMEEKSGEKLDPAMKELIQKSSAEDIRKMAQIAGKAVKTTDNQSFEELENQMSKMFGFEPEGPKNERTILNFANGEPVLYSSEFVFNDNIKIAPPEENKFSDKLSSLKEALQSSNFVAPSGVSITPDSTSSTATFAFDPKVLAKVQTLAIN